MRGSLLKLKMRRRLYVHSRPNSPTAAQVPCSRPETYTRIPHRNATNVAGGIRVAVVAEKEGKTGGSKEGKATTPQEPGAYNINHT